MTDRPIIVCLCGSTRFSDAFRDANLRETLAGRIVLSIGCDMRTDADLFGHLLPDEIEQVKTDLDELHKRKINLADEVLVLNVDGYIGDSTRSEVGYAITHGKALRWLEPGNIPAEYAQYDPADVASIPVARTPELSGDAAFGALLDAAFPPPADLTDAELAEIETRAAADGVASVPGPWWVGPALTADDQTFHLPVMYREPADEEGETFDGPVCSIDYDARGFKYPHADNRQLADFIAAARTDVPRLVAALRAAREDLAVHHADDEALSTVLVAALGDRFSPDGPLADAVGLLVEQRDIAHADRLARAQERDTAVDTIGERDVTITEMNKVLTRVEDQRDEARAMAQTRLDIINAQRDPDLAANYAMVRQQLDEARAALARAEQATADAGHRMAAVRALLAIAIDRDQIEPGVADRIFGALAADVPAAPVCNRCHERTPASLTGLCEPCTVSGGRASGSGWADVPAAADEVNRQRREDLGVEELPGMWETADFTGGQTDSPATADHETHPAGEEKP